MIRAIKAAFAHVACAAFLACVRGYCRVRLAYYRLVIAHLLRHRPTHPDLTALHAHAFALDDYLRAATRSTPSPPETAAVRDRILTLFAAHRRIALRELAFRVIASDRASRSAA